MLRIRLNHEVAGVQLFLDRALLAALHVLDDLERHQDLGHDVVDAGDLDPVDRVVPDSLLTARLAAKEVPLVRHPSTPAP